MEAHPLFRLIPFSVLSMDSAKLLLDFSLLSMGECLLLTGILLELLPAEMTWLIGLRGFIQNTDSAVYHPHTGVDKGDP